MNDLQAVREALEHYAKMDDGVIEFKKGFAYKGEKDEHSPARKALALLDAHIKRMESEELVEEVAKAIRIADGCGSTVNGEIMFCDDIRMEVVKYHDGESMRHSVCECKEAAKAAINTIRDNK